MTIQVGDHTTWTGSGGGTASSSSRTTQASGSTLVLITDIESAAFTSHGDNKGNTYTPLASPPALFGNTAYVSYCENAVGGTGHIFNCVSTAGFPSSYMVEIKGGVLSGILAASAKFADTASPFTTNGGVTVSQNCLLIGFVGTDASSNPCTHTHGNSFLEIDAITDAATFWSGATSQRSVSSGTYDTSVTTNTGSNALNWLLAFKEAAAAADVFFGQACL